jgi:hypothetical protein
LGSVGRAGLVGPPLHRDQAWFEDLQAIEEGEDLVAGPRRDRVCGAGVNRRARCRCLRVRHVDPSITLSDVERSGITPPSRRYERWRAMAFEPLLSAELGALCVREHATAILMRELVAPCSM